MAARKSAVRCSLAACPRAWCPLQCLLAKTWRTVSRCGLVWRMCSGVCSSKPYSQWAESARPNLLRCFLSPQWPVRRWKMVVWVLLSRVLIWSSCGSYPLFFSLQADFCFCFRRVLTSLYEVERWGCESFAAALASLPAVSFPAMPTCAGTHWSTTLLLLDTGSLSAPGPKPVLLILSCYKFYPWVIYAGDLDVFHFFQGFLDFWYHNGWDIWRVWASILHWM